MQRLQNTALSTKNIASALLLDTYTADADRQIMVGVSLSGLAGTGTYKVCLTRQRAGSGAIYQSPTTAISLAATVTTAYIQTISMAVLNTDVVKVYAVGLAGDTSVAGAVETWDTTLDAADLAAINAQVDTALSDINLDHLIKVAKETSWAVTVTKESVIDLLTSKDTDQTFERAHDALEAIRDRGDLAWLTGAKSSADSITFPASVTKVVGGTLTGDHTRLAILDGTSTSLAETTTTTFLELLVTFAATAGQRASTLKLWGYYAGGAGHYIRVQVLDQTGGTVYEDIGTMPIAAVVSPYSFDLAPNHISAAGACVVKFLHSASASGIGSHVLYLDKVELLTQTPDPATVNANMTQISGDSVAADRLEAILDATPTGTVSASPAPSATVFTTSLTETTADHYNGAFCVFTSGVLLGQSRKIADYDGTDKIITTSAFTEAPGAGDAFLIIGRSE
jgi:hypothetical protein